MLQLDAVSLIAGMYRASIADNVMHFCDGFLVHNLFSAK